MRGNFSRVSYLKAELIINLNKMMAAWRRGVNLEAVYPNENLDF